MTLATGNQVSLQTLSVAIVSCSRRAVHSHSYHSSDDDTATTAFAMKAGGMTDEHLVEVTVRGDYAALNAT